MRCKKSFLPILVALLSQTSVASECLAEMESGFCWPTGKDNPRITTKHLGHGSDRGGTYHRGRYHLGVDISAKEDSKVYPVADGVVVGKSNGQPSGDYKGSGWTCENGRGTNNYALLVRHKINDENGTAFVALYGHMKGIGAEYNIGDSISVTDSIGVIGSYPCGGDHLHFSIWPNKSTKPTGNYGLVFYRGTKDDPNAPWPKDYGQTYPIKFLKEHEPFKESEKRAFFYNGLAWIGSYDCYDQNNEFFEAEKRDGGVFLTKNLSKDMCISAEVLCDKYEVPQECTAEKPIDEFDNEKE